MENPEYLIHIRDRRNGNPYKAYSSWDNFCVEIYETVEGRWHGEAARRFDANRPEHYCRWREHKAGAKLIMRIHKGDLLRLEHEGTRKIMVVHRLEAAGGQFKLAPQRRASSISGMPRTTPSIHSAFRSWLMASYRTLKRMNATPVRVDELGRVWQIQPKLGER